MTDIAYSLRHRAQAFTRPVFAEMARSGAGHVAVGHMREHMSVRRIEAPKGMALGDFFNESWQQLALSYCNDYIYKNELVTRNAGGELPFVYTHEFKYRAKFAMLIVVLKAP